MQLSQLAALLTVGVLSGVHSQPTVKLVSTFRAPTAPTGMSMNENDGLIYMLTAAASSGVHGMYVFSLGGVQKCSISVSSNFAEINGIVIEDGAAYLAGLACPDTGCVGRLCIGAHFLKLRAHRSPAHANTRTHARARTRRLPPTPAAETVAAASSAALHPPFACGA